jgi:SAM-dependent methyltransferase
MVNNTDRFNPSMGSVLRDLRTRSLATGVLSYVPGLFAWWDRRRPMGNTASAPYCRGIWEFHLSNYRRASDGDTPSAVAELGPGATLGVCIAALLDGTETATALDAGQYAAQDANLRVFDELIASHGSAGHTADLRSAVFAAGNSKLESRLRYRAPWTDPTVCEADSLDFVFSHSVLEHVDDPGTVYRACFHWLKPGGLMSHKIDHSSHGITRSWNGHYAIPPGLWRMVFGNRPYLLNRLRPLQHIDAMERAGFRILDSTEFVVDRGDTQLLANRSSLPDDDTFIRTSTVIAIKPG